MAVKNEYLYEPRTMMEALRQNPVPKRFFQRRFFKKVITHETTTVELDVQKTKRMVAGYTSPSSAANIVERDGYYTVATKPAYIKEKIPMRVADVVNRQMGENIYNPEPVKVRAARLLGNDLRVLDERIVRREEFMCAEALLTGKIIIKGTGLNHGVDFGYEPGEHIKTLSGSSCWDHPDSDPMKSLDDAREAINQRCGVLPDTCVVGRKVYWAILNNPKVKERLDNTRYQMGIIKPADFGDGVRYLGTLAPSMLDVLVYDEMYYDPAEKKDKPLVPDDVVLIGSSNAMCSMNYGLIQNLKGLAAVSRFPLIWEDPDGGARWVQLESSPIPNLVQSDAFMVMHVLGS